MTLKEEYNNYTVILTSIAIAVLTMDTRVIPPIAGKTIPVFVQLVPADNGILRTCGAMRGRRHLQRKRKRRIPQRQRKGLL